MTHVLLVVAGLMVAGLLSPGPNFVLISGRALSSGGGPAAAAACGVSIGSVTHAVFGAAGFGALLQSSAGFFTAAKLVGAAYLVWIGFKSLRGAVRSRGASSHSAEDCRRVSVRRSLLDGYLTQMSNPKSTLFFLAIFTTVVPADMTIWQGAAVVATVGATALGGYLAIGMVLSQPVFQAAYGRVGVLFEVLFGAAMVALGIRVAASSQ